VILMLSRSSAAVDVACYLLLGLVYAYVLGPALVVVLGSFNSATSFPSPFETFTLRWYAQLLQHREFVHSMRVSLIVAAAAAGIATLFGGPAAFAFVRGRFRLKDGFMAFFTAPLVIPQIVLGLSMLQLLSVLRVPITTIGLVLVHAVFVMPFVLRTMITSLTHFDRSLEEAAMSLGATGFRTLWHVTLPLTKAGLTAGFVFAFIMSFVNVPLSMFLAAPASTTLPVRVFAYMESRLDPLVAAVGAFLVLLVFTTSLFLERVLRLRLLV
jgi:putative spermidine/putrescine transport system permease protein